MPARDAELPPLGRLRNVDLDHGLAGAGVTAVVFGCVMWAGGRGFVASMTALIGVAAVAYFLASSGGGAREEDDPCRPLPGTEGLILGLILLALILIACGTLTLLLIDAGGRALSLLALITASAVCALLDMLYPVKRTPQDRLSYYIGNVTGILALLAVFGEF